MPLVSRRKYADMRGVDPKTVRKAIKSGKIPLVGGMIDPEIADAAWERNRDAGQQSRLAEAIEAQASAGPVAVAVQPAEKEPEDQPAAKGGQQPELDLAPLTKARIEQVEVTTAIREITRRKLEGDLLEREEVERTWGELLQGLKDRLRLIPDNVGDALASTNDAAECRSIVMKEIMEALGVLSKQVGEMAAA